MLVENSLVAVISLPAGCFNPYSGVKTSILILDKSLARQAKTIAFFKVENDGFGLGAQRRAIEKNDLPKVQAELAAYLNALRAKTSIDTMDLATGLIVPKEKIAANGDYNLSCERYREGTVSNHSFPLVALGEESLFRVESGGTPKSDVDEYWGGGIPWATLVDLPATDFISQITTTKRTISNKGLRESSAKMIPANSVIVSTRATIGRIAINRVPIATNQGFKNIVIKDSARIVPEYVAFALTKLVPTMQAWATGGTFAEISKTKFCELQIPLPPLEVQKEIVAEIEDYQKVINGDSAVVDNSRPQIPIDPGWPMVELGEIIKLSSGRGLTQSNMKEGPYPVYGGNGKTGNHSEYFQAVPNIVIGRVGAYCGAVHITEPKAWITDNALYITEFKQEIDLGYLAQVLTQLNLNQFAKVGGQPSISQSTVCERTIPLPPIAMQHVIVAEIKAEQTLVNANRELIVRFEKKIQATLARIWGGGE
jgi:type I restriction enzyme M protein